MATTVKDCSSSSSQNSDATHHGRIIRTTAVAENFIGGKKSIVIKTPVG
jgi:hypothetical protein